MKRLLSIFLSFIMALDCLTAASAEATAVPAAQSPESGLQTLVDEGLISQETLTAILNYMKENQPAMPDAQQSDGNPPAMPDGQQSGGNPPAMPDAQQPSAMLSQTLLSDLLNAAIRTDRGGGTITVDGGSYTTNGLGSPVIYSTADIDVANATLISNLSEGVCIEGKSSITLTDCDLTVDITPTATATPPSVTAL